MSSPFVSRSNLILPFVLSLMSDEAKHAKRAVHEPLPECFLDARGCIAVLQQHRDANVWYLVPEAAFLHDVGVLARQARFPGRSPYTYLQQAPEVRDYTREMDEDEIMVASCEDNCMCQARQRRREESTALERLLRCTWKAYRQRTNQETGVYNAKFVITLLGGELYQ